MLKKLYKYEFESLFRWLVPFWIGIFALSLINRLASTIGNAMYKDYDTSIYYGSAFSVSGYMESLVGVLLVTGIAVMMALCAVMIALRFKKNMYSNEGYLTLSLPVTATQHIICKFVCALAVTILTSGVALVSLNIAFSGNFIAVFEEVFDFIFKEFDSALLIATYVFGFIMVTYACISLGQNFKNKTGGAILCFVIIYVLFQIYSVIFGILKSDIIYSRSYNYNDVDWNRMNFYNMIFNYIQCVVNAGITVAAFFITKNMLSKRLNLE